MTNKLEHLARRLLDELGLSPRLYTIIGGDTLGPGRAKPAPDLLLEMVARGGLSAHGRAAYVGDSSFDTGAARAAHLPLHHRDPADRFIIATALELDARIISLDEKFPLYEALAGRLFPH